ncbi:MAG TPA: tetraacyldisaccharide 4'-kinase [Gemmatimonadales bacterium]|nr:tetraacyldisaccharide 4'-kinase [Gemmatimonadales bacterium]
MRPETLERIWFGNDPLARAIRTALMPAELLFRGASGARSYMYGAGILSRAEPAIPALSVGNLTVGGTGKTPVSAWFCAALSSAGAKPAVVLRGYGSDEVLVHEVLNPGAIVVTGRDRVQALDSARAQGADVAVLDDAFQHRSVARAADVVLISADEPFGQQRMLPAGPWREPLSALKRASIAIVTRKAASEAAVRQVSSLVAEAASGIPIATASLRLGELRPLRSAMRTATGAASTALPLASLAGASVLPVAALGNPRAFVRQLEALGASVRKSLLYPDHHDFTHEDVTAITSAATDADFVVCSLKDAVKLAPVWPREGPEVWYVTQSVTFERGEEHVTKIVDSVLAEREHSTRP